MGILEDIDGLRRGILTRREQAANEMHAYYTSFPSPQTIRVQLIKLLTSGAGTLVVAPAPPRGFLEDLSCRPLGKSYYPVLPISPDNISPQTQNLRHDKLDNILPFNWPLLQTSLFRIDQSHAYSEVRR